MLCLEEMSENGQFTIADGFTRLLPSRVITLFSI